MTEVSDLLSLTTEIVSAHVSNNNVSTTDVPQLIRSVFEALGKASNPKVNEVPLVPAVPIRSSIKRDHIVCLEDGAKLKMLKRYLRTNYALSPEEYRSKWGLPRDYPMVAPEYAEKRSGLARKFGLGRKKAVSEAPALADGVVSDVAETITQEKSHAPSRKGPRVKAPGTAAPEVVET